MKENPDSSTEKSDRLSFEGDEGWYQYDDIPFNIYYQFNCPEGSMVSAAHPAAFGITPNMEEGHSLSVWLHESVPENFRDIVMYHELTEAQVRYATGLEKEAAHEYAVQKTLEYARTHLSEQEFKEFEAWEHTLDI